MFTGKTLRERRAFGSYRFLATFIFHASHDRQLLNFNMPVEPIMVGRIIGEFERQEQSHTIEVRLIQEYTGQSQAKFRNRFYMMACKSVSVNCMESLM